MNTQTNVSSFPVDDVPVLIGLMKSMGLSQAIDDCLKTNGNHKGLSSGLLAVIWLTFILTQGDHRKSAVRTWVAQRKLVLEQLLEVPISDVDFTDDRLGLLAKRFGDRSAWEKLEENLWKDSMTIITPNNGIMAVRVDASTFSGLHQIMEEGLMQLGNSKAHRPDLAQFKLMSSAHQPSGRMIANDIHPGNAADDPLYIPIITRTKAILGKNGVLYLGDCKMAALETRATIVSQEDFYMMPFPMTGFSKDLREAMIADVLAHPEKLTSLDIGGEEGLGFEQLRPLECILKDKLIQWNERVILVQFPDLHERQVRDLERRLTKAKKVIEGLTPPPGRGKRVFRRHEELLSEITKYVKDKDLEGLLDVKIECREKRTTKSVGRGRNGPDKETVEVVDTRFFVKSVQLQKEKVDLAEKSLGWRLFGSNKPLESFPMDRAIVEYRKGWGLERNFHILKSQPIGISPLFVQKDDQIEGLTKLLLIGTRVMSEIELRVRACLKASNESIAGLYPGLPKKETTSPTAVKLLQKVCEAGVSLVCLQTKNTSNYHLTNLTPFVERIMQLLGLDIDLYKSLQKLKNDTKYSREK
jgi:transposase